MLNKESIKEMLIQDFKQQKKELEATVKNSREHANDKDLKPDGKYDTRATEAKYLADAMAKKLEDISLDLQMLEDLSTKSLNRDNDVCIGAAVFIQHNDIKNWYYISPVAGGKMLKVDDTPIVVISAFSPLGAELIGSNVDDEVLVETPKGDKIYLICDIQ